MRDRTPVACLAIVAVALTFRAPQIITNRTYTDWWQVGCWLVPWAPVCPVPIKDPPMPKPRPEPIDCDIYGPCQY